LVNACGARPEERRQLSLLRRIPNIERRHKKNCFPLPRIDDTLDPLAGTKLFSNLGFKSAYWQDTMHPEDNEKTALYIGQGQWEFTVMPFTLRNGQANYELLIKSVLRGLTYEGCLEYLDDVIAFGRTFQEQLDKL
jgi:hypothetical protein